MTTEQALESILTKNPYLEQIETAEKELNSFYDNLRASKKTPRISYLEEKSNTNIEALETQAAHWDYEQCLKYRQLTPIEIPSYMMERVAPVLKEIHQYAPDGATVKIRIQNHREPFQKPKIRIEVLGTLNGSETVRARFEDSVGEFFSHPVLNNPRDFTYNPDATLQSIAPFTVMNLPELSYSTGKRTGMYSYETVTLRRGGYYIFVPFIIDDK